MASTAWLHGSSVLRLTEGLVSVLKDQRPEHLPTVLASYREHGVLSTQSASTVGGLVGFSNAKLGSNKTRFEGLCLLSVLVKDGSSDLFEQHCLSWLRLLQQVIQSHASGQTIKLVVSILKDLLQYSSQLPELSREVGLNSILGILTSLLGLKAECELWAMEGMMACMTYYPRACGSLRDKLGAYFLTKMDCTNKKTQEMACQCYGRLPCLGGLLDRGVNTGRAEGWTNQVHCLVATANALLAEIYQGSETDATMQYDGPGVELGFPNLDQTDPMTLLQLQQRYTAVCLALKHTLRSDPASPVRVPIRPVLHLVCRALAVSCKSINLTGDGSIRLLILPMIHNSTLEVLAALITIVRSGMVQYTLVLQRLFSQTLASWAPSHEASVGQQRAYSSVRVSVYRTLELWVQVAGASASILQGSPVHSEILFSQLLRDIAPGINIGKLHSGLSADETLAENLGARRNKPLAMGDSGGTSLPRKGDHMANQDTCLTALRALRQVILTSGALLKDDIHKRLHEVVLPLCAHLQQQHSSSSAGYEAAGPLGGQYRSSLARRELYRLLMALILVPSPCWPSPLTCAVSIFSKGRNDSNLKISTFCTEALTICNSLLHPRTPSTALPLPPLNLKSPPAAPVLTSTQGPGPTSGLTLPTLLGATTPGPIFSVRQSLNLGPSSLLGSLDNQMSLVPGLSCPTPTPGEVILSPAAHHLPDQAGLGPAECQRPVFVRYEKEEGEDVEISLASDSDDSVVIVPPGMLNMENSQDAIPAAANSHSMLSVSSGAPAVTLPAGECAPVVASSTVPTTVDSVTLQNNLSSSSTSPLITSNNPVNSCPSSSTSLVSMVPTLNVSTLTSTSGLGNSVSNRAQLQQMLMQPSAVSQPPPIAPPLQMHQLQNQLTQQGRPFHQRPSPLPTSNEDTAIININSTDDEEEEEDIEDEEDVEEDEEDEDEEVSDFAEEEEEEFYDGEEYEDYDEEEAEELEEEGEDEDGDMLPKVEGEEERCIHPQEVEGDIPPLEGAEDNAEEPVGLQAAALNDESTSRFSVEGDVEGGIEEIQNNRVLFGDDRIKVQEVESIGVLEEARADEEDEGERTDDPSMPQILCVTGGALEERELMEDNMKEAETGEGEVLQEAMGPWEDRPSENEPVSKEECTTHHNQQQTLRLETKEASMTEMGLGSPSQLGAAATAATPTDDNDADKEGDTNSADTQYKSSVISNSEEMDNEGKQETMDSDQQETGKGGIETTGEESKGLKRKIDAVEGANAEGKSPEKKKLDDEAMASMLADFVACPPDDEDHACGLK